MNSQASIYEGLQWNRTDSNNFPAPRSAAVNPSLLWLCQAFVIGCALAMGWSAATAVAVELLSDPSFEDPIEIESEGSQWEWVYGFLPMPTVIATSDPRSGAMHAELMLDTSQLFTAFGPTIRSTAYAGSGASAAVTDFTGMSLTVGSNYKVTAFNISSPDFESPPSLVIRTYLAYFSDVFGFLGFGGIEGSPFLSDVYPEGVTEEYQSSTYMVTVPNFGTPVTSVDFTIGLIASTAENGQQMTGTATVLIDDVSIDAILPITSDFNGDGIVDAADYTVWRNSLGTTELEPFTLGDANGDGAVDQLDYDIWKSQYGQVVSMLSASATVAPEPSCLIAVIVGMICFWMSRAWHS